MTQAQSPLAELTDLLDKKPKPVVASELKFWHSDDYTEIRTGKLVHFLSRKQAAAVRLIHEGHLKGRLDVPGDMILKAIDSECTRMASVFLYSSAWQTLVISPFRRGFYSLSPFVTIK